MATNAWICWCIKACFSETEVRWVESRDPENLDISMIWISIYRCPWAQAKLDKYFSVGNIHVSNSWPYLNEEDSLVDVLWFFESYLLMSWDLFDKLDSRSLFGRENLKIQHFFQHLVLSFGLFVMISRISIRVMNKTNTRTKRISDENRARACWGKGKKQKSNERKWTVNEGVRGNLCEAEQNNFR